jgi:hypothetical protein
VKRLARLTTLVPELEWEEAYLEEVYEHRSGFAHGRGLNGTPESASMTMYSRLESGLRAILRAAILDTSVAAIFESEASIRSSLNLSGRDDR